MALFDIFKKKTPNPNDPFSFANQQSFYTPVFF